MFGNIKTAVIEPVYALIYNGISRNGVTSGGIYEIRITVEDNDPKVWVYELQHKQCIAIIPFKERDWHGLKL